MVVTVRRKRNGESVNKMAKNNIDWLGAGRTGKSMAIGTGSLVKTGVNAFMGLAVVGAVAGMIGRMW